VAVNAAIRNVAVTVNRRGGIIGRHFLSAEAVRANPAIALPNVCPAFRAIRPILVAIAALPFIPQNWRTAVSMAKLVVILLARMLEYDRDLFDRA
jgi:hypothetical protein